MYRIDLESVGSTNTYAKELILSKKAPEMPFLITSKEQTAGRGRTGHSFFSPKGTGIYMSVAGDFDMLEGCLSPTAAAAVAVHVSLAKLIGKDDDLKIKWVNDIYLNGKKCCGILTESFYDENGKRYFITGTGVNLYTKIFPDDISGTAGAVIERKDISEKLLDTLPEEIAERFVKILCSGNNSHMDYYREHSFIKPEDKEDRDLIRFSEGEIQQKAKVIRINDDASLEIVLPNGQKKRVSSGEIEIKGVNYK